MKLSLRPFVVVTQNFREYVYFLWHTSFWVDFAYLMCFWKASSCNVLVTLRAFKEQRWTSSFFNFFFTPDKNSAGAEQQQQQNDKTQPWSRTDLLFVPARRREAIHCAAVRVVLCASYLIPDTTDDMRWMNGWDRGCTTSVFPLTPSYFSEADFPSLSQAIERGIGKAQPFRCSSSFLQSACFLHKALVARCRFQ